MVFQAGVTSKWTNDGLHFLLEHFDAIHNSPSQIYHSALPLTPPSWLHKFYDAEISPTMKVVKGHPVEWGLCSRTTILGSSTRTLSYHTNSIAVGSMPGDIIILDTITGTQTAVLSGHTAVVYCVAFSLDGASLVSGSWDYTIKLWDVQTGGVVKTFSRDTRWISSVSISADYTTVAAGCAHTFHLWDIQTGECHHTIEQQPGIVYVMFSPTDSQHLISISGRKIWQWNANGHLIKPPFDGHHVSFSPNGAQFVSCHGKTVAVRNSSSGEIASEFQITDSDANMCTFSPDSRLVAVASVRIIYCWSITSPEPQLVETFLGHTDIITSLVFSSPTTLISAALDKSVKFWQIRAQSTDLPVINPKYTPLHSVQIRSITLQTKGGIVITSDSDGMVKTWDISTGIHRASFQTPAKDYMRDVQLVNEGLILAYYTDEKIHIWDGGDEQLVLEVGEIYHYAEGIRISGDGSKVFLLRAPSIGAWSIQTGKAMGRAEIEYSGGSGFLTVDGLNVWAHWPQSEYEGWAFGISGSTPTKLSGMPTFSNGSMVCYPRQGRIRNVVTGGTIVQLSGSFANPTDVQCGGSYLAAGYESGEILILELKHVPLE